MGLSSIALQQREKEDEALKSFIVFSLVGSVGLHVAVLSMSNLWVKETKLAEEPIEVIVLDPPPAIAPPKVEAAKPEPKPPPKIGDGSKPLTSAKSNSAPAAKLAPQQEASAFSPPKVEKQISPKTTNIEKPVATPLTPKVAEIPPTPIPTPKVAETLPPVPTPSLEVVQTPTPVASLPSDLIAKIKSTPTPTPKPVAVATPKATPKPVVTSPQVTQLQPVKRAPVTATPQSPVAAKPPAQNNRIPDRVRSPNLENSNALKRSSSATQNTGVNSDRSLFPNSQNPAGNNSNPANNVGSSGAGGNSNNSSDRPSNNKLATAPSNNPNPASEELLSPGSGSGGLACRRCPHPAYPRRAEKKGLQGTVQVVFDADRSGNVSNVKVANSSGHDILDRAATQAVKGWKLRSSNSEQQGILQSFTFAKQGSDIEQQARERREQQEQERLAREKQQQERLAREKEQQERLAREKEQQERQQQQDTFNQNVPQPSTPTTLSEPVPTSTPIESDLTAPEP